MNELAPEQEPILIRHAEAATSGTVVCAAVIAAGAGHTASIGNLVIAIVITVCAYWLVHVYAAGLALIIRNPDRPRLPLRVALRHSWPAADVSLLPVGVLLTADLLGAALPTAATMALGITVGLFALYAGIAGQRAGLGTRGIVVSVMLGACLGLALVLVKAALH